MQSMNMTRQQLGDAVLQLKYQFDAEVQRNEHWTRADRLDAFDALLVRVHRPLQEYERLGRREREAEAEAAP